MNDDDLTIEEQCQVAEYILDGLAEEEKIQQQIKEAEEELATRHEIYEKLVKEYSGDHEQALFEYCFLNNICFSTEVFKLLTKSKDASIYAQFPDLYINTINADFRYENLTFFKQLHKENFEKIYSDRALISALSEEDKKNRQQVIEVFSYDPFKTEPAEDKPQLYRDLAGMSSEVMRRDVAKQKAAISVVRSYGNIEKYQRKITELTGDGDIDDEAQTKIDQYMKIISNIQSSVNQTAEKNNFTVKGIGGASGKGALSDVMTQIEDQGIDEGITNFYDIATSKSIEEIANISMKAQLNQINLSKTDYADILATQMEIVKDCQRKAKDALEALRLVKEKIVKQELLDELAYDYKKKGLSEEEIAEFISREYHLKDGID